VLQPRVQQQLLEAVRSAKYDVVWLGTPCSSFSVLWLDGTTTPPRTRSHPEGVHPLPPRLADYISKHNAMADFSAALAQAAFDAGCTYVIENPVDRGMVGSPHFRWATRAHVPLWLMPSFRKLSKATKARWVTFAQCAFGGDFQKLTTLMAAGPRAATLRSLERKVCVHGSQAHARQAKGYDLDGKSNSAAAAAYPPLMCACVAALLVAPACLGCVTVECFDAESTEARALLQAVAELQDDNAQAAIAFLASAHEAFSAAPGGEHDGGEAVGSPATPLTHAMGEHRPGSGETPAAHAAAAAPTPCVLGWRSAHAAMPQHWPERADVVGERAAAARSGELRYVSRRRSEPEQPEVLARRPLPVPHPPPKLDAHKPSGEVPWPAGAPPRPIHISMLYNPGVYDNILSDTQAEAARLQPAEAAAAAGEATPYIAAGATRVYRPELTQPEWARGTVWDTSDPEDCVPLQPYSEDDPPAQEVRPAFFKEWGERLEWPDLDMLEQVQHTGVESRSTCERCTVIHQHHRGLRENYLPARESVDKDTKEGWISSGRRDLWTVPARLVPKNVVLQSKWRVDTGGDLVRKLKARVTTDDSMQALGTDSRNGGIDRDTLGNIELAGPRTLAEAVAIVKAAAPQMNIHAPATTLERIALWALDLSDAYRRLAAARSERWMQSFVWHDGVRYDKRCVFGSAHLVDVFQRISSFVLAVASHRIKEYDAAHPYDAQRQRWAAWRSEHLGGEQTCDFASIYLDDGSGLVCLEPGEPLRGARPGAPKVSSHLEVGADGRVRFSTFGDKSRAETHLAIVRDTFMEAGWGIAIEKVQLGFSLDLLGLHISAEGEGYLGVQEVKRRGMIADIDEQLEPSTKDGLVDREAVEQLVGRTSFTAQVAAEGNAYLQPLFAMQNAKMRRTVKQRQPDGSFVRAHVSAKPRRLAVAGDTPKQQLYRMALEWWRAALEDGISVPLAPRLVFPELDEPGCAFIFTDAAREDGTGFGGFTMVHEAGHDEPTFLYIEQRWDANSLSALQANTFSMPAGEAFGAVTLLDAVARRLCGVTHIQAFTDSDATARALTTGNSGSPQLDYLVRWLFARHPGVQFLGIHQAGVRNSASDGLSRHALREVLREAAATGAATERLEAPDGCADVLRAAMAHEQRVLTRRARAAQMLPSKACSSA